MTVDDNAEREWLAAVYDTAISDTRWAKEQGWRATEWSLVLSGGVLALYRYPFHTAPVWIFVLISAALATLFNYYLCRLHVFAKKSRSRNDAIKKLMPEKVQYIVGNRGSDPNHVGFLVVQIIVIWCSFGLVVAGLNWIHAKPN